MATSGKETCIFHIPPSYVGKSHWTTSLMQKLKSVETQSIKRSERARKRAPHARENSDTCNAAFAIISDPINTDKEDSLMHVYTLNPEGKTKRRALSISDPFEYGLVKVCPIDPVNIHEGYWKEHVNPLVKAIRDPNSPNHPEIKKYQRDVFGLRKFSKEQVSSNISVTALTGWTLVLGSAAIAYKALPHSVGEAATATVGALSLSVLASLMQERQKSSLTRKDVEFRKSGEGIFSLEGRSSIRVDGIPHPEEFRGDMSVSMPGC